MSKSALLLFLALPFMAWGKPHGEHVHKGKASFQTVGNNLDIRNEDRTILHWQSFSIERNESVRFIQPNSKSFVLNRVTSKEISSILGNIHSNGSVFLINPNGVVIGCDAHIQTAGFIASTADITDQDFLLGQSYLFSQRGSGEVKNYGRIECSEGDIYLIGKKVTNEGTLKGQNVGLFADQEVLICPKENQQVLIAPTEKNVERLKEGLSYDNPYEYAINQKGVIQAISTEERDGQIYLVSKVGAVHVEGNTETNGGQIYALGETVRLTETSIIDSSGPVGGKVFIGGDYQGNNPEVPNARLTYVDEGAQILADGIEGSAGRVIIWGDDATRFFGNVSCQALGETGDGGFVEISSGGNDYIFSGAVSTLAKKGRVGQLLLDPVDIVCDDFSGVSAPTFPTDAPATYEPSGMNNAKLDVANVRSALKSNDVIISTNGSGKGGGDISFKVGITWDEATNLNVQAYRALRLESGVIINCTADGGSIALTSSGAPGGSYHGIYLDESSGLSTTTGAISLTAVGGNDGGDQGIYMNGGATIVTTTGDITLKGTSRASQSGKGVLLTDQDSNQNPTKVQTTDGAISITGKGSGGNNEYDSDGVRFQKGSLIESTGLGTITIHGEGSTDGNLKEGDGVNFEGTAGNGDRPTLKSAYGDVLITGIGHGSDRAEGVVASMEALIQSTGTGAKAAKITLNGTGSDTASTQGSPGISLTGDGITVTSVDGDMTFIGLGKATGGVSNNGVELNGVQVSATGEAKIAISGTSDLGVSSNPAVKLAQGTKNGAQVTSVDGDISITGIAGGSQNGNQGISLKDGSKIKTTGKGKMTLKGTGASGMMNCQGIFVSDAGSELSTVSGDLTFTAAGGGLSIGTQGLYVVAGGQISTSSGTMTGTVTIASGPGQCEGILVDGANSTISSDSGTVNLNGTGGGKGQKNRGIYVTNSGSIKTNSGSVFLTGNGGGTQDTNQGILVDAAGTISASGNGTLNLTGNGGSGTIGNHGIEVDGSNGSFISTVNGIASVTGNAVGSGVGNMGVLLHDGGKIQTTGGALNVTGTGSASGTGGSIGVNLVDSGTQISTQSGEIQVTGIGKGKGSGSQGIAMVSSIGVTSNGGAITIDGTGGGSADSNQGIFVKDGAKVQTTGSGNITVNCTGGAGTTANHGIEIDGVNGSLISTENGIASITGNAAGSGLGNTGVLLHDGGKIQTTGGALNVTGTGSASGTGVSAGVYLADGGTQISTQSGAIQVTGTGKGTGSGCQGVAMSASTGVTSSGGAITIDGAGGGSTDSNQGVLVQRGAKVQTTGSGNITITSTGGAGTTNCHGFELDGSSGSKITSANGALSVTGEAGGSSSANRGIFIHDSGQVQVTGSGKLTFQGTGSNGTTDCQGIYIADATSEITTSSGDLMITASGQGSGAGNHGLVLESGAALSTASGKMTISSTAASGANACTGILIDGTNTKISSNSGVIDLTGTGGANGQNNRGVHLSNSSSITSHSGNLTITGHGSGTTDQNQGILLDGAAKIEAQGSATLSLIGDGKAGTTENHGIEIDGSSASTVNGLLSINGVGSGNGSSNYGFYSRSGGTVKVTGDGDLMIVGKGSATGNGSCRGVYVSDSGSALTVSSGRLNINGTGQGTGDGNQGVVFADKALAKSSGGVVSIIGIGGGTGESGFGISIQNGASVVNHGLGTIQLEGTGAAQGTTMNHGVELTGTSTQVSTADGLLQITGQGNGVGLANYGVHVSLGGEVVCTGSGGLTLDGMGSSNGTGQSVGVLLADAGTQIHGVDGAILIKGKGQGSNDDNLGIIVMSGARVASKGKGTISLEGTGSQNGGSSNHGMKIKGSGTKLTSSIGNISLAGTGKGLNPSNVGVYLSDSSEISSTGAATIQVSGVGGAVSPNSFGVMMENGASVQSTNGNVLVQGKGSSTYEGISLDQNCAIISEGTALLKLVAFGDLFIQNGSHVYSKSTGELKLEATRDIWIIGGSAPLMPAYVSPTFNTVTAVTGRDLNIVGGSGNRSEAQLGNHDQSITDVNATINIIGSRNINVSCENTGSFALIGHGNPSANEQTLKGNIILIDTVGEVNLNGATAGGEDLGFAQIGHLSFFNGNSTIGGNVKVSTSGNINIQGGTTATSAYARIGHKGVEHSTAFETGVVLLYAGYNIDVHSKVGRSEVVNHNGKLTLVVDGLCFVPPMMGSGAFKLNSLISATDEVRIYTSMQEHNAINDSINGILFFPAKKGENTQFERWATYYPGGNYGGGAFCIFYKEPQAPLPPAVFPVKEFFRNISANLTALPEILPLITDNCFEQMSPRKDNTLPENPHHPERLSL